MARTDSESLDQIHIINPQDLSRLTTRRGLLRFINQRTARMTTTMTDDVDSYSIEEFCRRNGISKGTFYNLRAAGEGPKEKRVRSRVLISKVAAAEWLAGAGA
jgi:hypothetical protein